VIEAEDGVLVSEQELVEMSKYLSREDFQTLVLSAMRKQSARVMILEQAVDALVKASKRLDVELSDHRELITKLRRKLFPDASQWTPDPGPVN
jgi:hypothetical protein